MAIKLIKYRVRFTGKTFFAGDIIKGLSEQDETSLVKNGFAKYLDVISDDEENNLNQQIAPPTTSDSAPNDSHNNTPSAHIVSEDSIEGKKEKSNGETNVNIKFNPDEVMQPAKEKSKGGKHNDKLQGADNK